MATTGMTEFVTALPKVELHLHLIGSAAPETVLALARRHPDGGVPTETDALRRFYAFTGFPHFLDVYAQVNLLVRTGADGHRPEGTVGAGLGGAEVGVSRHPLPALLAAGVPVTLATDDHGMFHTDLNHEYLLCHDQFGLGTAELAEIARAGARAAFCGEPTRAAVLAEIDLLTPVA